MSQDQAYREAALRRRFGMSAEAKARLDKFNAEQTDWYGVCRICHKRLEGTPAQLRAHMKEHEVGSPSQ